MNSHRRLSESCRIGMGRRFFGLTAAVVLIASSTGCMHRRMTVRSDPPGALVIIDGEERGFTPASVDFTYYGTREVTLVKDGYETLTLMQKVRTPWYQYFPIDFVSDNFLPFSVTNRHDFSYKMQPKMIVPTDELLNRGNELRSEALMSP